MKCIVGIFIVVFIFLTYAWIPDYTYPHEVLSPWEKIGLKDLVCPSTHQRGFNQPAGGFGERPYEIYLPKVDGVVNQSKTGWWCHGKKFISVCDTNFLFMHTYSHIVEHYAPSYKDCLNMIFDIKHDRNSESMSVWFPSYECSWMELKHTTRAITVVEEGSVHFDPYEGNLIHAAFPGGKCAESPCELIHGDGFFLTEAGGKFTCDDMETRLLTIVISYGADIKIRFQGVYFTKGYYIDLQNACKMKFCGKMGLLTLDGLWLSANLNWDYSVSHRTCVEGDEVSTFGKEGSVLVEQVTEDLLIRKERCLDKKDLILGSGVISNYRLSFFRPLSGGINWIYFFNGKSLYRAKGYYNEVERLTNVKRELGLTRKNVKITLTPARWSKITQNNYSDCDFDAFNGIMVRDCKIIIPDIIETAVISEHVGNLVKHEMRIAHSKVVIDSDKVNYLKKEMYDEQSTAFHPSLFSGFWIYFWIILGVILFVVLSFCIFCCCCPLICRRLASRKSTKHNERRNRNPVLSSLVQNDKPQKKRGEIRYKFTKGSDILSSA